MCCEDFERMTDTLFFQEEKYGCIIKWNEVIKDGRVDRVNHYGIAINYCPFCGELIKLTDETK